MPDPSPFEGSDEEKTEIFWNTAVTLKRRIDLMLAPPLASQDRLSLQREIDDIGQQCAATNERPPMSVFKRYLSAWVLVCIVVGIVLAQWLTGLVQAVGAMEVAKVNLPVGLLV